MESATEKLAKAVGDNIQAASSAALYLYVIVAVLRQSDAELILPSSVFDLGGLLDKVKEGIPGGSFVAPILQVQVPLTLFYALGPAVLLAIHAAVVLDRKALPAASAPIRLLVIWSAPLALALIRWRFAPYVSARPTPPMIGQAMEALQTLALVADAVVVIAALQDPAAPHGRLRRRRTLARAVRHAATLWLIILLASYALHWPAMLAPPDTAGAVLLVLVAALLAGWIAEAGGMRRALGRSTQRRPIFRFVIMEDVNMLGRTALLVIFFGLAALPSFARALDLSGETLVAHAPSDTLIQTLLADNQHMGLWDSDESSRTKWIDATGMRIADARNVAWHADGRGISLAKWNFPGGSFDRATMALINLSGAHLEKASLDSTNMIGANLTGAYLNGASLRYALLEGANLSFVLAAADATPATPPAGNAPSDKEPAATETDTSPCVNWPPPMRTNFSNADLRNANLDHADLTCANLSGVTADGKTKLNSANLTGADLGAATLSNAKLNGVHARFVTMTLTTKLDGADLDGADFSHATLHGVDFSKANNVNNAIFDFADVRCAIFPAKFYGAHLTGALVEGAKLAPPETKPKPQDDATARMLPSLADGSLVGVRQRPKTETDPKIEQELGNDCQQQPTPPK